MTALDDLKTKVTKLEDRIDALSKQVVIVGTIVPYGGPSEPGESKPDESKPKPPDGWLWCDGASLDRGEYPDLYHAIGTNFGAPDETHFNLPDLRGRFVRGVDHGAERDPDASKRGPSVEGGNIGDHVGSLQDDAYGKHNHTINSQHAKTDRATVGKSEGDPPAVAGFPHSPASPHTEDSGGPETRPKNVYVNWIIYAGV